MPRVTRDALRYVTKHFNHSECLNDATKNHGVP